MRKLGSCRRLARDRTRTRGAVSLLRQPDSEKHAFLNAVLKTGYGIQPEHHRKLRQARAMETPEEREARPLQFRVNREEDPSGD